MTATSNLLILNFLCKKNRILLMKINRSVMLLLLSLSSATTSHSILIFIQILFLEILPLILLSCMESYSMTFIFPGHWSLITPEMKVPSKRLDTMPTVIQPARMILLFPWNTRALQRKMDGLTVSNGSAPKYTIIKAGFVIAITLAALPKETGQLIPMKTWICACFLVSNVILMNGIASIK